MAGFMLPSELPRSPDTTSVSTPPRAVVRPAFWVRKATVVSGEAGAVLSIGSAAAKARLAAITPEGHEAVVHLTLTDDHPWAQAFVVIEARPMAGVSA